MSAPRNIVEFVDNQSGEHPMFHKHTGGVLIDGNPVCVAKGSIDLEFGENEVTAITLRLLPTEIRFSHQQTRQDT